MLDWLGSSERSHSRCGKRKIRDRSSSSGSKEPESANDSTEPFRLQRVENKRSLNHGDIYFDLVGYRNCFVWLNILGLGYPVHSERPELMASQAGISKKFMVLIVEDDPLICMMLEDIVDEAGFDFESAINATDGIAALEKRGTRFSALITDIRMPGKGNGWDVGHRAHELLPLLPIIYMTGDSAAEWKAHGEAGSILLQKPFANALLIAALSDLAYLATGVFA